MAEYKRILVAVTPHREEHPALARAVFLANKYNAVLVLGSSMYNRSIEKSSNVTNESCDDVKKALIDDQKKVMEKLAASLNINTSTECIVTWNKKWYEGVIDLAVQADCNLIIKETKQYKKSVSNLFTPDHWNLLRYSPINVLMVSNTSWEKSGDIVTAVSLDGLDIQHQRLTQEVAKESVALAKYYDANLHFVNTVTKAPMHIAIDRSSFDPDKVNQRVMAKHKNDIQELADNLELHDVNIIVKEGLPGKVVPNICNELDAKLLVLGSVGRKGINAALLGNTAEYIIDKINCDTLVIKG
ncbi:universal stress protein UspE [Psychrobium sp. nBUS_13]|uniref:universal stress protein UspE n=1 Tax=Psychrobium sp. nBUS_13 TaxID=3395319 RepID=UPI003EBD0A88